MILKIKNGDDFIEVDTDFPDNRVDYAIINDDDENKLDDTLELKVIGDNDD